MSHVINGGHIFKLQEAKKTEEINAYLTTIGRTAPSTAKNIFLLSFFTVRFVYRPLIDMSFGVCLAVATSAVLIWSGSSTLIEKLVVFNPNDVEAALAVDEIYPAFRMSRE